MAVPKRPGIRDIARAAGVSPTTVSHALNNSPDTRVAEATRARVVRVARELGYAPNGLARALRTSRSNMLAILSDDIATAPYAGKLLLGAQEAASRHEMVLVIMPTGGVAETEERDIEAIWRHQVDGVLYADTGHKYVTVPTSLSGKPVLVVNAESRERDYWSVFPDEMQGGWAATSELISNGHQSIGFLNTSEVIPARQYRLAGYRKALQQNHIAFRPELVVEGDGSFAQHGYLAARAALSLADRPTALVCFNDRMAMGAYRAAAEVGLSIPRDLSVIGFDNQEIIAEALYPQLTTLALPYYEMGVTAVGTMVAALKGRAADPTTKVVLPNELIRRASVAGRTPAP